VCSWSFNVDGLLVAVVFTEGKFRNTGFWVVTQCVRTFGQGATSTLQMTIAGFFEIRSLPDHVVSQETT
jgi:hypothetical protein